MRTAPRFHVCFALALAALAASSSARATCWHDASTTYGIPVELLKAIASVESNFNATARGPKNGDGTYDIGLVMINSGWLPKLAKFGITEPDLMEPCTNLKVGAWVLADNVKRLGWNWNAIGAYNVGCAKIDEQECGKRRAAYAWKVYRELGRLATGGRVENAAVGNAPAAAPSGMRRTVVIELEVEQRGPDLQLVHLDPAFGSRDDLTIGGFLNYAEVRDE